MCATACAQDAAKIMRAVMDATGAVVAGAKIVVSNPDKDYRGQLKSDGAGTYVAPMKPIGCYGSPPKPRALKGRLLRVSC